MSPGIRSGMFAIVSDIHANLEAFTAVLHEIDRRGIQHIVCLGDIIGYGDVAMPGIADGKP
jgi:predicted phosphodiesterase